MVSRAMEIRKDIGKMENLLSHGLVQRTLQTNMCFHGTIHRRPSRMKRPRGPPWIFPFGLPGYIALSYLRLLFTRDIDSIPHSCEGAFAWAAEHHDHMLVSFMKGVI